MNTQLKFKVNALRTLASPYKKNEKEEATTFETIYYLLVNMKDLPENIPLDVNPRVPKMGTNVAKRLINAVVETDTVFYLYTRGIVISATSFGFHCVVSEVIFDIGERKCVV